MEWKVTYLQVQIPDVPFIEIMQPFEVVPTVIANALALNPCGEVLFQYVNKYNGRDLR